MNRTSTRRSLSRVMRRRFTLVEIMVVMLIIGMVLGLVGPFVMKRLQLAKQKNTKNQLLLLRQCIDNFYLDNQAYPQSLNDLITNPGMGTRWKGPYVTDGNLPKDAWENDFHYQVPGTEGHEYDIYSYGNDNAPGGEGTNADIYPWSKD